LVVLVKVWGVDGAIATGPAVAFLAACKNEIFQPPSYMTTVGDGILNPIPIFPEAGWLVTTLVFYFIILGFLFVGALTGLLGRRNLTAVSRESQVILAVGLLLVLLIAYAGKGTFLTLFAVLSVAYASFVLANHITVGRRGRSPPVCGWRIHRLLRDGPRIGDNGYGS